MVANHQPEHREKEEHYSNTGNKLQQAAAMRHLC